MKRRLTNTTFFDGYTGGGKMKDESDTTVLLDYTQAGGWNLLPDFAPTDAALAQRDKALVAIKAAQDLLSTWIVPDSRISDHQVLNDLLGVLDNKDLVLLVKECGK